ncbi:hypothetical protein FA13DRAFT_1627518 [Coprinellus micaceus]|uniref:Uncharacterized protein n=1 Tax=Coprinellus micaceus TaxID=71717 RepID=A0A4Y7TGG6_COPMI|nr:hypothetical protein FA13DRAFT_1627518 [Coprinellus micaceus]
MTEPTRWVVIDDRDSRVQYSSGWSAVSGDTYNNQGNFGPTYRNSLHGTGTDGASLSFKFTGSAARIKGTTALQIDSAGVPNPDWECILDGRVVKRANPFQYVENNWVFCAFDNLPGGEHTIGLNAKPKGRNFWFDYIEYRPTGTVDNEVVVAGRDDADLSYSTGWAALANVGHNTMIRGSTATFRFIGTGIGLYAMFPTELPHNEGQATYSIDNGPSTTFTIPGGGDISVYNRKIFEVTGLSKQAHTIVITYTSTGRTTPLVVAQMFIEGGTNVRASASSNGGGSSGGSSSSGSSTTVTTANPNTSTISVVDPSTNTAAAAASGTFSTSSSTTPGTVILPGDNATPSDVAGSPSDAKSGGSGSASDPAGSSADGSSSSQSNTPIGAIVGAVLGAIAVLLLLFLLMWYRRRRRIQLRHDAGYQSSPFSMTRNGHHSPDPPAMYTNQPIPSISAVHGSEPPLIDDTLSGTTPSSSMQASVYPAVHSKSGPAFNSPYISNHSPYNDGVSPNEAVSSVTRLVPNRLHHQHHHQQSSVDHSVSAYSGYTTHTNSSLSSAPSRAVFHEDSGIRLPAPNSQGIVEYPPMYSAR